jgi:DNA polymerase (family 10)
MVLKGSEVDILEDGSLDLPDSVLRELDVVVISVHSKFNLDRDRQTGRILRALDHPYVTLLAHPTGRLLLEREPYALDMERVLDAVAARGCFVELNAHPLRLDLHDLHVRMARERGIPVVISNDAHGLPDFDHHRHGILQARRGWLEKKDVLNTLPLAELRVKLRGSFR